MLGGASSTGAEVAVLETDGPRAAALRTRALHTGAARRGWIYSPAVALVRRIFPAALVFGAVGWTALSNGGFFATSWGWPTLVFLLTAIVVVIVSARVSLSRLDLVLLVGLAGFVGWSALSALWAPGAELPVQAAELALVYLAGVAAFLLLGSTSLPFGVLCAVTPVAAYALATRLVPDHVGTYNPRVGGYLLAGHVGYQNGLGMLCTLASLVALGLVAHASRLVVRSAAGVSLVILLPTLYFTFSRGAAAALLLGILVAVALDPRRLRFSLAVFVALPLPLVGAWLGSRSTPLTRAGATLSAAAHDGHRLALVLLVLAVLQAGAIALLARFESRLRITPRIRRVWVAAAGVAACLVVAIGLVRIGNPVRFVSRATDAFRTDTAASGGNLNRRLVTLSGHTRSDYWAVAWHEVRDHPWLGGGGETFRRYWLRYRPVPLGVLNAHNLYLETLAELGPMGLVLLIVALAVPLAAAARARASPLAPIAAGAYVAALAHAAIDWDWQLPALTLATFALGTTLVIAAREPTAAHRVTNGFRAAVVPVTLALVAFVFAAQLGNNALAAADRAATRDDDRAALADSRTARMWLRWAARPWQQIGEAQLAAGNVGAARASFREAISRDDSDWSFWLDLALTTSGRDRRRALAQAARLNPLGRVLHGFGG
jgi:O-Antigen ligase